MQMSIGEVNIHVHAESPVQFWVMGTTLSINSYIQIELNIYHVHMSLTELNYDSPVY